MNIALAGAQEDPCSTDNYLTLGDIAKRSPNYYQDAVPLCDRYLPEGWYRAGFHEIPTTAPGLLACGTTYPYWMDGEYLFYHTLIIILFHQTLKVSLCVYQIVIFSLALIPCTEKKLEPFVLLLLFF